MHRKLSLICWNIICAALVLTIQSPAGELKLIGTHPTSTLTPFPAITALKAFEDRIYLGYGDMLVFPAVTLASYQPAEHKFRIEFSPATDLIDNFREIDGVLYIPSADPHFLDHNRDYSYLTADGWRDFTPAGLVHIADMASTDGSDLWMVGSKPINETATYGPAVFRSSDRGRTWTDVTILKTRNFDRYLWGFALQGHFHVYDAQYEGTNGVSVPPRPYLELAKATPIGHGTNEFVVAASAPVGTATQVSLVTFDARSWRTIRSGIFDFTIAGTNLFALQSRSIWKAQALGSTGAVWMRLDFTNVPPDARVIEVHQETVYVGDARGRLWAGSLNGTVVNTNAAAIVNELSSSIFFLNFRRFPKQLKFGPSSKKHGMYESQ